MQISPYRFESLSPSRPAGGFATLEFPSRPGSGAFTPASQGAEKSPTLVQEELAEEEVVEAPAPQFTEGDLEAAKAEAFKEGFNAGKKEAAAEHNVQEEQERQEILQVVEAIRSQMPSMEEKQQALLTSQQQEIGKLVLHCSGRLSLEALRSNPITDIEKMIRDCMNTLMGRAQIVVTVHPKLLASLSDIFGKSFKLKSDAELSPGDCLINWENGQAERRIDDIWHEVETIVDRYFSRDAQEGHDEDLLDDFVTDTDDGAIEKSHIEQTAQSAAEEDDASETENETADEDEESIMQRVSGPHKISTS